MLVDDARKTPVNGNAANDKATARSDRSYQQTKTDLETVRKPIADQADRLGRLVDSIDQQTPQADALIAPELLTVIAGGQGSGLRMNEAEISRVIGGRSNYEGIKAALNKWQADPSKALSITPAQRDQMRRLVSAVANRNAAKMAILDQAAQDLIDAPDVQTQRQIIVGVKRKLSQMAVGDSTETDTKNTTDPAASARKKLGLP